MTAKTIRQTMFTTGEVDQELWKRTDVSLYTTGAQRLLNAEVGTTGLVKKRKGTQFLYDATAITDPYSQMYDFIDKNYNNYIIISADNSLGWSVVPLDENGDVIASEIMLITGDIPYLSEELPEIDYGLDNDVLVLTHPNYKPARIYISDYTPGAMIFSWEYINFTIYPSFDFGTINYSAATVAFTSSATTFSMTLTPDPGFTSAWIGGIVIGLGKDSTGVGYGYITSVTPGVGNTVIAGRVAKRFNADADMPTIGSQYSIQQPSWSDDLGWPAKVQFYQNRLWFANTKTSPTTVFGSKINDFLNFDVGTGEAADAIVYSIGQTGSILWLNAGKQLEIYCRDVELAAPQNENSGLTPSTFSIRQQSAYGASNNIKPLSYINDSYFVIRTGNAIINFHFEGIGLTYSSTNISLASKHLVKNPIDRALLRGTDQSQDNFIYFLNEDGTLITFQFAHLSDKYNLAALTPAEFLNTIYHPENPFPILEPIPVTAITTVNNQVYMLKQYQLTGMVTLEKFNSFTQNDVVIKMDGWFEASAVDGNIYLLENYEGYYLQVIYEGQDYGQYLVQNGQIHIDDDPTLDAEVTLGIVFRTNIRPMYLYGGETESNFFKNLSAIYVDYFESMDFRIDDVLVPFQTFEDIQAGLQPLPKTDTAIIYPVQGWNRFNTFSITQDSPFDLQVTAIAYQLGETIV